MYDGRDTLTLALEYRKMGWSLIPISPTGSKKPMVKWERYMREHASEDQLREWFAKGEAWIGAVTGRISGICVVDIDTIAGEEAIKHLYGSEMLDVPSVKTRSGGRHLYFAHPGDRDVRNKTRNIDGCDFRGDGGYVVIPPSPGYEWVQSLEEYDLPVLPSDYIRDYIDTDANSPGKEELKKVAASAMFTKGRRDNDLYSVALKLLRGGMKDHDTTQVLVQLAKSWGEDMSKYRNRKWVESKIISAAKLDLRKHRNLAGEVRKWIDDSQGWFSQRYLYEDVGAKEPNQKKAVREELARLVKEGVIERHRTKTGEYRKAELDITPIDFKSGITGKPLDLILPMGLHEEVHLYPGNLIVVAGEPNSGKSGFLLRFARDNMNKFPIDYYSSEMGADELRIRLEKFDDITLDEWHINAIERSFDFEDILNGDRISIIDYMEMLDDFWLVGKHLQAIHNKMQGKRGLTIVAIQKKRGQQLGRGAEFALEKPRLYLSMGTEVVEGKGPQHFLEVVKAKNWAGSVNPNGLKINFKLIDGCLFLEQSRYNPNEFDF